MSGSLETLIAQLHINVTDACLEYHNQFRRQLHVTPKSFLAFLDMYSELYRSKSETLTGLAASLTIGLRKLDEAKADVSTMKVRSSRSLQDPGELVQDAHYILPVFHLFSQVELSQRNGDLAAAALQVELLLKDISVSTAIAERERLRVAAIVTDVTSKAQVRYNTLQPGNCTRYAVQRCCHI